MPSPTGRPALFLDFDNTITRGDVLDAVIDSYSRDNRWREWERAWQEGRLSTRECLRRQMGNLRVTRAELLNYVSATEIDPCFVQIADWAARVQAPLTIVSDNFSLLIHAILERHGIRAVPVFANELKFSADRVEALFPYLDPACPRCANCKAQHLRRWRDRVTVFAGDGLSDLCAARAAHVVFAKDSLAEYLGEHGVAFSPFVSLQTVLQELHNLPIPILQP